MTRTRSTAPYLLLLPFVLSFAIFTAYPLMRSIGLSTQQTYGPGYSTPVGLKNFRFMLEDQMFWTAVWNTTLFTAASVLVQIPLALALAVGLNRPGLRGRAMYRLVFFAPVLVGLVFVAVLFRLILESRTGLLNVALHRTIGFDLDFPWLRQYSMASMVLAATWVYTGFHMVYLLAALQSVRPELNDAAAIDGAGRWGRFWHVTLPAIRPVLILVTLMSIIGSLQIFELPWMLFDGAGYDNRALTVVMYLYQNGFETGDLGYASAIGWALALALLGLAALQVRSLHRAEGATT